ncbi:unnamed protein product, partial [Hapterophycus canaliculatus]
FVLGTRQGDPNCGVQTSFTPSSDWMPPFMRVNPVIDWNYGQVWGFLRDFGLPYCSLYDHGYTSLGGYEGRNGEEVLEEYLPAYKLLDWSMERAGR